MNSKYPAIFPVPNSQNYSVVETEEARESPGVFNQLKLIHKDFLYGGFIKKVSANLRARRLHHAEVYDEQEENEKAERERRWAPAGESDESKQEYNYEKDGHRNKRLSLLYGGVLVMAIVVIASIAFTSFVGIAIGPLLYTIIVTSFISGFYFGIFGLKPSLRALWYGGFGPLFEDGMLSNNDYAKNRQGWVGIAVGLGSLIPVGVTLAGQAVGLGQLLSLIVLLISGIGLRNIVNGLSVFPKSFWHGIGGYKWQSKLGKVTGVVFGLIVGAVLGTVAAILILNPPMNIILAAAGAGALVLSAVGAMGIKYPLKYLGVLMLSILAPLLWPVAITIKSFSHSIRNLFWRFPRRVHIPRQTFVLSLIRFGMTLGIVGLGIAAVATDVLTLGLAGLITTGVIIGAHVTSKIISRTLLSSQRFEIDWSEKVKLSNKLNNKEGTEGIDNINSSYKDMLRNVKKGNGPREGILAFLRPVLRDYYKSSDERDLKEMHNRFKAGNFRHKVVENKHFRKDHRNTLFVIKEQSMSDRFGFNDQNRGIDCSYYPGTNSTVDINTIDAPSIDF